MYNKLKILAFGILFFFIASNLLFFNNGIISAQSNFSEHNLSSIDESLLTEVSANSINHFRTDIELKSFSTSSNHYYTEPITLFVDENILIPISAGSIHTIDFYDSTNPADPIYLGSSEWNGKSRRWELNVTFDKPGVKAITADIVTTEGYTTQTSSLIQINDDEYGTKGIIGNYYSAMFGIDSIAETGWEGVSGHFEDSKREIWLAWEAEIEVDVQLHEITRAYYDSSTSKWYPTKESIIKLTAEANRVHGIIYHESFGNLINFQVSDLEAGGYVDFGRAGYRWFGDSNDNYVYMHNKRTFFSGSYCIGMKMDIDLDMAAWSNAGKSWSTGALDYRWLYFGFKAQAVDATVVATAMADDYYLIVYDRESPTMNGPDVENIFYYYGGLRVTNPEFLKNSVKFRADFTPMDGIPSYGTHEYRWRLDFGVWSPWITTSNTYGVSPYFNKGSSGSAMVKVEVRDTYFWNTRDYGELFYWDYTGSYSNVNYDNLVKSTSSTLNDITTGTLRLAQDYANPTDYDGCGLDRTEDIWKYKDINNNWQTIGTGSGDIDWYVNNLPDANPGYQLSYYTEDRLGNGRTNSAIWMKTNNKVPLLHQGSTYFSGSYTVDGVTYVHESTDWTVAAFDNVGVNERDDGIQSMYIRIWTDNPFPFPDEIHYEDTITNFAYAYTSNGHIVYTLTITDIFDLPALKAIHDKKVYLDFRFYDGLGAESTFMRYGAELRMDYRAEHHGAGVALSNVSPTYTDQSITYISGTTRLGVTGNDPDIISYEWFVNSASLTTTVTNYYDLNSETLLDGQSYNFKVKVKDRFGNTFMSAVTQQYTVDNTIPDVDITSIFDNDMLKGIIPLEWTTEFTDIKDAYWQFRYWDGVIWKNWENITDSDSDYSNPLLWDTISLPEYPTYEIRIIVLDRVSLTGIDVVGQITIDNVKPIILEIPDSLTYELGTIDNNLFFNVSDLNPAIYSVYRDGVFQYNGSWINNDLIAVNLDGLDVSSYSYYLTIYDDFGNSVTTSEIAVTVEDSISPLVTEPIDITYVVGSIGNVIGWTATDLKPWIYSVYLNDSHLFDQDWVSGELIELNIDGLNEGIYSYRIEFYDQHGNWFSNVVIITVLEDNTAPSLVEQEDITLELGDIGDEIMWNAGDINPDNYILYIDGELIVTDSWTNETPVIVNLDGLELGTYVYRIEVYDQYTNMVYDEVTVIVVDATIPELIALSDITYEENSIGNEINWSVSDLKPDGFYLYINETLNETGLWINSEQIAFNIDGLSPGIYNYTIVVFDTSGNYASDEVIITVTAESTNKTSGYGFVVFLVAISLTVFITRKRKQH